MAVAVVLEVGLVVLLVVGDEVGEREAVVRSDVVDARVRPPAAPAVQVARAGEAARELADQAAVALPVRAHGVAVLVVPLGPAGGEVADLVAALAEVPGLGDQLDLVEHRVLAQQVEERAEAVHLVQLPGERGREVEAEAVDVHLEHPVAKRVHEELQHARMHHVQRVAAAGEVEVVAAAVGEPVVGGVVDAAEGERRPELVALGGVVVDDVEDHLDPGRVERLHHRLELLHLAGGGVARLRGEEADGVVAPVVAQPALDEPPVVEERLHRHQLDRRHAEAPEIVDHRRAGEPGVRAAERRRHVRVQDGEAAHVRFVDHRLVPRHVRAPVVAPGERGVDHLALGHRRRRCRGGRARGRRAGGRWCSRRAHRSSAGRRSRSWRRDRGGACAG